MKKILILQNKILHYRKPLYNELAKNYQIVVLHSGIKSVNDYDLYQEIVKKKFKFGPFYFQHGVLSEVRNDSYDVVISMFDLHWINNILAMYLCKKKTKFIWWGTWLTGNRIADMLKLYFTNQKKSSIFYTQEAKESFIRLGVDKRTLFVANNTFNVEERIKCYDFNTKKSILFVGSLDKRKQNDFLIMAFNKIKDKISKKIILIFIGDGCEKDNLMLLVEKMKLKSRVFFEGQINDTELLKDYYKNAIVSVSFGQAGLSVLQSFGYGVPFMTKKNAISGGEITNIIHNINGVICEDRMSSLQDNLFKLCVNLEFSRKLGKNAYNYYGEFCTITKMAEGFISAIENKKDF